MAKDKKQRTGFTGAVAHRRPRRSVVWVDDFARRLITISGIGSIVAVSLVGLFLVWVVLPLFKPVNLQEVNYPCDKPATQGAVLYQALDNYGSMMWSLRENGQILVHDVEKGQALDQLEIRPGFQPSCWAFSNEGERLVFGYDDGRIVTVKTAFDVQYINPDQMSPAMVALKPGQKIPHGKGLAEKTNEGQIRISELKLIIDAPQSMGNFSITLLAITGTTNGLVVVAMDEAGSLHERNYTWRQNLLTGNLRIKSRGSDVEAKDLGLDSNYVPSYLALNDAGDMVLLVGRDGLTFMLRRTGDGVFAKVHRQDLLLPEGRHITSLGFLAGQVSVVVGDNQGGLVVWLPVRTPGFSTPVMEPVHHLTHHESAVTALTASGRSRMVVAGYADGTISLMHVTSKRFLGEVSMGDGPVRCLALSPREDLLVASSIAGMGTWKLQADHADISYSALLEPVWYEGYDAPGYVWQSSSASDTFEHKLSLIPLVFGTLKATFYSMLFGLPLAFLAALYTSEFLHKKIRAKVKPVIEIMASLPSVVLGFLAALVVAPAIEQVVPQTLSVMFLGPFFILLGAHLWQLLPRLIAPRLEPFRPVAVLLTLVMGGLISWQLGGPLEGLLFQGDMEAWLDGRISSGTAGCTLLLLPASGLLVGWLNINFGEGLLRSRGLSWTPGNLAVLDLGRFLIAMVAVVGLSFFLGWLLSSSGWDPRGGIVGTYVQRNALIVGFAMGFAVIPIIYSIAEDSLSAVPDHLRAASLGAGATVWQTAIKVVVPPAMSGLFSAGMIGLGRAVGETMIVLMAAGNTPIMEMNIFNGFRTLSANLAVELPEAVQFSTHYRTLFLAALTLFLMTFVLNTVAELVRLHFRRKSSRL